MPEFIYYPDGQGPPHVKCTNGQQHIEINWRLYDWLVDLVPVVEEHDPWKGQIAFQGTPHQSGWTWRCNAPDAEMENMALLFTPHMDSEMIYTMSFWHYADKSREKVAERKAYRKFFKKIGIDKLTDFEEEGVQAHWVEVPRWYCLQHVGELAHLIAAFV
jgi:hypothetical protein